MIKESRLMIEHYGISDHWYRDKGREYITVIINKKHVKKHLQVSVKKIKHEVDHRG